MASEIAEQPEAVARTLDALLPLIPALRALTADIRHVLFFARGTSDHAAGYGLYLCQARGGRLATLGTPSLATHYHARPDLHGVLAVGISQSGETAEIVETLDWAAGLGARTVAVTNGEGSTLAARAELALVTRAGPELAVPATKTYTTQLAAMAVLAAALGPDDQAFLRGLGRVPGELADLLERAGEPAGELAGRLADVEGLVVTGRGFAAPTALELALKVEETCSVPALGLSAADLRHGPIAVLGPRTPLLLVAAADGPMLAGVTELAGTAAARGGSAYGIGGDAAFQAACTSTLPGPGLPEELAPLGLIVPGQLLVESLARRRGHDPDAPGGLTKVTQTNVESTRVQGG
jgi:glucosamine--fructose-6-phosphate aminotransferase (isomerizing)